jgi:single-strand DNA-binding protein
MRHIAISVKIASIDSIDNRITGTASFRNGKVDGNLQFTCSKYLESVVTVGATLVTVGSLTNEGNSLSLNITQAQVASESDRTINSMTVFGRLGGEPEEKATKDGKPVIECSLAVSTGKDSTDWYLVQAYDKTGSILSQFVHKGDQICIEGRLGTYPWKDKDGNPTTKLRITANNLSLVGKSKS